MTKLVNAVLANHYNEVLHLLLDVGVNPNQISTEGLTPLGQATDHNRDDIAILLLKCGADPNFYGSEGVETFPLVSAIRHENHHLVDYLLQSGANPNWASDRGHTPLMTAGHIGNDDLVFSLLAFSADPTMKSKDGRTALDIAVENEHYKIAHMIQNAKSVDLTLRTAIAVNDVALLRELLKTEGTDANEKFAEGRTPLILAVINQREEMIEPLLKAGAIVYDKDCHGRSVFDYLVINQNDKIKGILSAKSENESDDDPFETQLGMLREEPSQMERQMTEIQDTLKDILSRLARLEDMHPSRHH